MLEKLRKSKFDVKLFTPKDLSDTLLKYVTGKKITSIAESDWFEANVIDLTTIIKDNVIEILVKEEDIAKTIQEIELASNDFVLRLRSLDKNKKIAENLYDIFYHLYGLHVGDYKQISELIYANSYLALLLSAAFYQSVQPTLGIDSLNTLTNRLGKKEGLRKAFNIIHDIDYKSIYDVALRVVDCLPDPVFEDVINRGAKLGSNQALLKRDFSGTIYHKVVGDWSVRKGFATFFTTIPASYLIAYLAIFSEYEPYTEAEKVKVADFACGSGTLLTAAYSALEDLYKLERFEEGDIDLDDFHKKLLEQNFWGFDALRYALQIASLNLVFHNPTIALKNMNFYSIPLGIVKKNDVELGSLRFLKSGTLIDYFSVDQKAEKMFEEKSSYLLVPDRTRLNTTHIISMCLPSKTLSNIFYAVKLKKRESIEKYKALCVWLNSTFGLLLVIANREETGGAFVSLKMSHWRLQNILNIDKLKKAQVKKLSEIFDDFHTKEMQRLPQQYNLQAIDPVRLAFDKEILDALGIKIEEERLVKLYKIVYEAFSEWFEVGKTQADLGKYVKLCEEKTDSSKT